MRVQFQNYKLLKKEKLSIEKISNVVSDMITTFYVMSSHAKVELRGNIEVVNLSGSTAYGLADSNSDIDIVGYYIPAINTLTSVSKFKGMIELSSEFKFDLDCTKDTVGILSLIIQEDQMLVRLVSNGVKHLEGTIYDIRKLTNMMLANNPNALDFLWVRDEHVVFNSNPYKYTGLRALRAKFFSPKVLQSFKGYAIEQVRRMESHRMWLRGDVPELPTRESFGLPEVSVFPESQRDAIYTICAFNGIKEEALDYIHGGLSVEFAYQVSINYDENMVKILHGMYTKSTKSWLHGLHSMANLLPDNLKGVAAVELKYKAAKDAYTAYCDWKKTRNSDRALLEAEVGFDSKHGAQVIRLLTVCKEILESKQIVLDRRNAGDAQMMIDCKRGRMNYDAWNRVVTRLRSEIDALSHVANGFVQRTDAIEHYVREMVIDEIGEHFN